MESANPMSKHSSRSLAQQLNIEYGRVETVTPAAQNEQVATVRLTLLIDAKINVRGNVSGKQYVFDGAGSVVDVDARDVDDLLKKRQGGRQCCGGTEVGNRVFELSEN